jgi:hypothetical protein
LTAEGLVLADLLQEDLKQFLVERLVSYDQVAEAQKSNDSGNAMFGGLFLVVGLGVLGKAVWDWRMGKTAPAGEAPAPG